MFSVILLFDVLFIKIDICFMKILCVGDVVGERGVRFAASKIPFYSFCDLVVVNIENSSPKGKGISEYAIKTLTQAGAKVFTGGNHSFSNKFSYSLYESKNVLRPCNFPYENPGKGHYVEHIPSLGISVVFINVQLRTFMREHLSCPFRATESILSLYKGQNNVIFVIDVHGEATSEKIVFSHYFDGKVSAVFGTHTHIQTADDRIFPQGTGYITDVGMVGSYHSSLGVKFKAVEQNLLYQMPVLFELEEEGPQVFSAIVFEIDIKTKKCISVERVLIVE